MNTAYAVNKAWPNVVNKVAEIFFMQLTERIKNEKPEKYSDKDDLKFKSSLTFDEDIKGLIYMYLYSTDWIHFENGNSDTKNRYGIVLSNETKYSPDKWFVGVVSPKKKEDMKHHEKGRYEKIEKKLKELEIRGFKSENGYPGYIYAKDAQKNWEQFLEKLLDETEQNEGDISDYYVNFFWEFAEKAISILNKIEKRT